MMRLLTQGLTQEFLVELLDVGVLVALADGFTLVLGIKCLAALLEHLDIAMVVRLTSTTNTATGTCHYLNHMVIKLAGA